MPAIGITLVLSSVLAFVIICLVRFAAAADTAIITLESVINTQVGTGLVGEDATHILNNNILKYQANYTFPDAGTATITATLPTGSYWSDATVSVANGCGVGSNLNSDKSIATCILSNTAAGINSWSLSATAYGANGSMVQPVFTDSNGIAVVQPTAVEIVGAPNYNLSFKSTDIQPTQAPSASQQAGGMTGLVLRYGYALTAPAPVFGLDPLDNGAYSFSLDMSSFPSSWSVVSCALGSPGASWPGAGPSAGDNNAVRQSGTAVCTRALDGSTLTITVSGAYTGGLFYPPNDGNNRPLSDIAFYSVKGFSINIPAADLTPSPIIYTISPSNFTAIGAGGAINPGTSSGTASISVSSTPEYDSGTTTSIIYNYTFSGSGRPNALWSTDYANNMPLYIGQTYSIRGRIARLSAPAGIPIINPQGCYAIDPNVVTITGTTWYGTNWSSSGYTMDVEYGVLTGTTASQVASCGTVGDGALDWYPTLALAQAAGPVSAVRYRVNVNMDVNFAGAGSAPLLLQLQLRSDIPSGTIIRQSTRIFSDNAPPSQVVSQNHYAVNAIITNNIVASNVTPNSPTIPAGGIETISITPVIAGGTATGVTETVTLPSSLSYVAGSASFGGIPIPDPSIDISGNYVFALGSLAAGQTSKLVFDVNVSTSIIMPSTATVTAIIASDEVAYMNQPQLRTADVTFSIAAPVTFGVTLTQSASILQPGMDQTYELSVFNTTSEPVSSITEIIVLPFNGDSRGTTGLTSYLVDTFTSSAGLALTYTTDTAVRLNPVAAVSWVTYISGPLPSNVVAVKWTMPSLPANSSEQVSINLTNIVADNNAVIGNSISYVDSSIGTLSDISQVVAIYQIASITGTVYRDMSLTGSLTPGDTGLSGLTVNLMSGPTVVKTATTNAAGQFTFANVASGTYTVVLASTPSGLASNLDVVGSFVLAAGGSATDKNIGFVTKLAPTNDAANIEFSPLEPGSTEPIEIPILANDVGPDGVKGSGLTLLDAPYLSVPNSCSLPTLGMVEVIDNKLYYTPDAEVAGDDEFCYQVGDDFGQVSFARVFITLGFTPWCEWNDEILSTDPMCIAPETPGTGNLAVSGGSTAVRTVVLTGVMGVTAVSVGMWFGVKHLTNKRSTS